MAKKGVLFLQKKIFQKLMLQKRAQKIENVEKNLRNKKVIKKIFVKNKIINFIIA